MTTHTAPTPAPKGPDALPRLVLLEQPATKASKPDDDWRLSRSAKPLRTWRLSK